jgi:6-pyruvoyltetrahydropterin/6-carboxytetrahydropterin synthase
MMVEVEGEPTEDTPGGTSMLIDFKHVKRMVKPLVEDMDHATMVADYDTELKEALATLGSKTYALDVDSTAENLATHFTDHIGESGWEVLREHGVETIRVKLWETETCYAEVEKDVMEYVVAEEESTESEPAPTPVSA